ncbi:MAG TPA: kelch repeat-containing protein, partial [Candidatus Nitrosocosmicus sp.]|nr:kelch repeat-containing protein [Candidatus Nitrosocosmicus sp.]
MFSNNSKLIIGIGILFIFISIFLLSSFDYPIVAAQHWITGAPIPTPRSEIAGAVLNDKIYIVGGFDDSGRSTPTVEMYDPVTDKWTQSSPLPQPLDHTAAASYNGKLYVVGGGYLDRNSLSD